MHYLPTKNTENLKINPIFVVYCIFNWKQNCKKLHFIVLFTKNASS